MDWPRKTHAGFFTSFHRRSLAQSHSCHADVPRTVHSRGMRTHRSTAPAAAERGSVIAYFLLAVVIIGSIAGLYGYSMHNLSLAQRRQDLVAAYQVVESGAILGCVDLERAGTNTSGTLAGGLLNNAPPYALNATLSSSTEVVYERVVTAPFTNQSVTVRIHLTNSAAPVAGAKIMALTQLGTVRQTAVMHAELGFGWGAAILSDAPGDSSTSVTKAAAVAGNVVCVGGGIGPLVVEGGVLANGRVNTSGVQVLAKAGVSNLRAGQAVRPTVSMGNLSTAAELPDYTVNGATDQLFDFNRYLAVADACGTHYASLVDFVTAAAGGAVLEGVIAVDVAKSDPTALSTTNLPAGINVRGTLLFNFSAEFTAADKLVITAPLFINAANLSGVSPNNPATYISGYPPVFANPARRPASVNLSGAGFANFAVGDDLPALLYNASAMDLHGDVNICGVVYCPNQIELETKADGQTQYVRGALIAGGGVYVENLRAATTIVSYDPAAVNALAVLGAKGRCVRIVYRE